MGAPRIIADDGSWRVLGQAWSERVSVALAPVAGAVVCEHIGSTAVPGLGAKPILDLQVRVPELLDDELMDEVVRVKAAINPHEVLLVADSLTGQDAVVTARAFDGRVGITGIVLTRVDGDGRGGINRRDKAYA